MPHHEPHPPTPLSREHLAQLLRSARLRVTDVRVQVLEVLGGLGKGQGRGQAIDAAEVVARLPEADRVTVYRTLNTLVEAGLVHRVDPGDRRFRYGLTDHAHCSPGHHDHEHPHLICDACGATQCLDDALVTIQSRSGGAGQARRWGHIRQQHVTLHGTCEGCMKAGAAGAVAREPGTSGVSPRRKAR